MPWRWYDVWDEMRKKPKATLLPTQGIFNLPHHIGQVWEVKDPLSWVKFTSDQIKGSREEHITFLNSLAQSNGFNFLTFLKGKYIRLVIIIYLSLVWSYFYYTWLSLAISEVKTCWSDLDMWLKILTPHKFAQ